MADIILQDNNGGMRRRPRSRLLAGEQRPSNLIYAAGPHGKKAGAGGGGGGGGGGGRAGREGWGWADAQVQGEEREGATSQQQFDPRDTVGCCLCRFNEWK